MGAALIFCLSIVNGSYALPTSRRESVKRTYHGKESTMRKDRIQGVDHDTNPHSE